METYRVQLLPKAAIILKTFYDTDILEEESILEWAGKVRENYDGLHFLMYFALLVVVRNVIMTDCTYLSTF